MQISSGHAYLAHVLQNSMMLDRQLPTNAWEKSADSLATRADKVTISQTARTLVTGESNSVKTYDFSNMSPQRLLQVINDEIKKGNLSLDESGPMLLLIPISFSGGPPPPEYSIPTNLFARMEQLLSFNQSIHNDTAVVYDRMALSALRRLQRDIT